MISAWHLLWIVPLTSFLSIFVIAMVHVSGRDDDEGVKPK